MTMDGNMNLVRRGKAGYSFREPIHKDRFILPQAEVDAYVDGDETGTSKDDQVNKGRKEMPHTLCV